MTKQTPKIDKAKAEKKFQKSKDIKNQHLNKLFIIFEYK